MPAKKFKAAHAEKHFIDLDKVDISTLDAVLSSISVNMGAFGAFECLNTADDYFLMNKTLK